MELVIYGDPRTKKNSQKPVINKRTGHIVLLPSKAFREYEKDALRQIVYGGTPIDYRVNVKCLYYMKTHRAVDLTNLEEATDDILVKRGVLKDDNTRVVAGHDGSRVLYDKENPRVEITIERLEE